MRTLYVIRGSHACRSAMLMLEHKRIDHRVVVVPAGLHPVIARLRGFGSGGQRRSAGGRRPLPLRLGDRLGTVPGLDDDGRRVSTNHGIARFLDEVEPRRPLIPADPDRRTAVEAAERWANEHLQMQARRVTAGVVFEDPAAFARSSADGRLGCLLFRSEGARRRLIPLLRFAFAVRPESDSEIMAELPALLDRVDGLIADGTIGGPEPNVADCMVAPCLALMLYRPEVGRAMAGRPALAFVDRLLPAP